MLNLHCSAIFFLQIVGFGYLKTRHIKSCLRQSSSLRNYLQMFAYANLGLNVYFIFITLYIYCNLCITFLVCLHVMNDNQ